MSERDLNIDHGYNPDDGLHEPTPLSPVTESVVGHRAPVIPFPVLTPITEDDLATAPPELQSIAEFLRSLARAVKSARMYPVNNPIYLRSVTEVVDRLGRAFQDFNVIRVVVGQTRLYFQGESVYENTDPEDSLARLLFRDGIREISFHLGLDREEMARFLEMVRAALSREAAEDLVTQLWDDSLSHITYTAIDDMLDADLSDNVPPEFGSDFMNYVDFEMDFSDAEEEAPEPSRAAALAAAGEMHKKLLEGPDREILAVSSDELEILLAEVHEEDAAALMTRVLDTFYDVIDLEADAAAREVILAVVENALTANVAQRQFGAACHILESIGSMTARRPDLAQSHKRTIEGIYRTAADTSRLEVIIDILERSSGYLYDDVERYLKLLSPGAIPDLCDVLGRVESRRGRKVVCAVLLHLAGGRVEPFLPFLSDSRWYLVRNVLTILGQMKSTSVIRYIKPLVGHSEIRVRREALTALSLIGQSEAIDALVASLRDPDPRMRVSAAGSLSRLGRTGVNPLLQVVLAREFEGRSFEEKRGFFEALGRTNAAEILPYLKLLLGKKPLFKKTEAEEMRVCAVEALSRMRLPEVRALLDEATKDPSSLVRAAVTGARKRHDDEEAEDV
jgi:hypothetical protein